MKIDNRHFLQAVTKHGRFAGFIREKTRYKLEKKVSASNFRGYGKILLDRTRS